jgi:hypothetical protein
MSKQSTHTSSMAGPSGNVAGGTKKGFQSGKPNPRSDATGVGIEELKGFIFTYGNQLQREKYIKAKKGIADHIGRTSPDCRKELYVAIQEGVEPVFKDPEDPGPDATPAQVKRYDTLFKRKEEKQEKYLLEKSKLFRIIMGQCTNSMRNKLEGRDGIKSLDKADDIIGLLELIRQLVYSTDNTQYEFWKMQATLAKLFDTKQEPGEPTPQFEVRFSEQVVSVESVWGPLIPTCGLKLNKNQQPTATEMKSRNKFLALPGQLCPN